MTLRSTNRLSPSRRPSPPPAAGLAGRGRCAAAADALAVWGSPGGDGGSRRRFRSCISGRRRLMAATELRGVVGPGPAAIAAPGGGGTGPPVVGGGGGRGDSGPGSGAALGTVAAAAAGGPGPGAGGVAAAGPTPAPPAGGLRRLGRRGFGLGSRGLALQMDQLYQRLPAAVVRAEQRAPELLQVTASGAPSPTATHSPRAVTLSSRHRSQGRPRPLFVTCAH